MRGKVTGAKFPIGVYFCKIKDVKSAIDGKGNEFISVVYEILEGNRKGGTFSERVKVSSRFLEALGEPCEYGAEWDTNNWLKKELVVDVKYSDDEAKWPRYGHRKPDNMEPPEPLDLPSDEIPF